MYLQGQLKTRVGEFLESDFRQSDPVAFLWEFLEIHAVHKLNDEEDLTIADDGGGTQEATLPGLGQHPDEAGCQQEDKGQPAVKRDAPSL